jgi:transposase
MSIFDLHLTTVECQELVKKREKAQSIVYSAHASERERSRAVLVWKWTKILLRAGEDHWSAKEIVSKVRCSKHTVYRVIKVFQDKGLESLFSRKRGRPKNVSRAQEIIAGLHQLHKRFPSAGPLELTKLLNQEISVPLSLHRVRHYFRLAGIRFRKRNRRLASAL